jgi:hypothetical protein
LDFQDVTGNAGVSYFKLGVDAEIFAELSGQPMWMALDMRKEPLVTM